MFFDQLQWYKNIFELCIYVILLLLSEGFNYHPRNISVRDFEGDLWLWWQRKGYILINFCKDQTNNSKSDNLVWKWLRIQGNSRHITCTWIFIINHKYIYIHIHWILIIRCNRWWSTSSSSSSPFYFTSFSFTSSFSSSSSLMIS